MERPLIGDAFVAGELPIAALAILVAPLVPKIIHEFDPGRNAESGGVLALVYFVMMTDTRGERP